MSEPFVPAVRDGGCPSPEGRPAAAVAEAMADATPAAGPGPRDGGSAPEDPGPQG